MSNGARELQDLVHLVDKTPEWTVKELATVWHVSAPKSDDVYRIKKQPKVQTTHLRNIVKDLKRLGWTEEAAREAIKKEAAAKTRTGRAKAERKTAELLEAAEEEPAQLGLPLYEADVIGGGEHMPPGPLGDGKIYSVDNVLLTPELADKFLDINIETNRPGNDKREAEIASDILAGRWVRNGDRIRFALVDVDGQLVQRMVDGQKRCRAVKRAGVGVPVDLIYNLPPGAFPTIDTQQPRSAGNVLYMRGVPNANMTAAGIKMVWMYDEKRPDGWSIKVSNPHTSELYDADPDGWRSAAAYVFGLLQRTAKTDRSMFSQRSLLATYYVCRRAFPKNPRLNEFFDGIISGLGLPRDVGDPRYKLRRILANESTLSVRKSGKRHFALIITAYNSFMLKDKTVPIVWSEHVSVPDPVLGG